MMCPIENTINDRPNASRRDSRRVNAAIAGVPTEAALRLIGELEDADRGPFTGFVGWSAWLDIAPEGVNKATALADVVAGLGVDAADVLAIGDGRNDIEMLTWAGRGVAIGDACAEVQAAADHVTGGFADGGTVEELDRWFHPARVEELAALAS